MADGCISSGQLVGIQLIVFESLDQSSFLTMTSHNWLGPQPPSHTTGPDCVQLGYTGLVAVHQLISTGLLQDWLRPVGISPRASLDWFSSHC